MTRRGRLGTMLFLVVLVNGCNGPCWGGGSGTVSTGAGSGPTLARLLAACDSAGTGVSLTVGGTSYDVGGQHDITTHAKLLNPTGTSVTWTTGTDSTAGAISGASGTGTVVTLPDSAGVWQVNVTAQVKGKTLTITGKIRKNDSPPPPCKGEGSWDLPTVGHGDWSF